VVPDGTISSANRRECAILRHSSRNATSHRWPIVRSQWKTWIAFAVIYFVWGSTFLAIKVGVAQVPPLVLAAMRFTAAGLALCLWARWRGMEFPRGREWLGIALMAVLIFAVNYGLLFWAEQRVPSGTAAVILATIPAFMSLAEIALLGSVRLTLRLGLALLNGFVGVLVLADTSLALGGPPVYALGAIGLVIAGISWSVASVASRRLPLPSSKVVSSGAQMLLGGGILAVASAVFGELGRFHPTAVTIGVWLGLLYLIVMGSVVGFTAYTWLIHRVSPTKVGTYAYVNPVVAVLIGYLFGGERLDLRTLLGTALVVVSVILITTGTRRAAGEPLEVAGDCTAADG
jgi:drug/metabolite transporter (DMT)-like permease